jgi:xylulokinase
MKKKILLGIDAGTSSLKVCAFSLDGSLVKKISKPITLLSNNAYPELDVQAYWGTVSDALREISSNALFDIIGVGLSTTCPTMIIMDEDYEALRPGIPYLNNCASSYVDSFISRLGGLATFLDKVGNYPATSTCSIANVAWVRDMEPEVWKRAKFIGMLNSYLAAKLTGKSAIDPTQASYSGVFDMKGETGWDEELLGLMQLEPSLMLPIMECTEQVGCVSEKASELTGLPTGVSVAIGSADTAAAAFGIGFVDKDIAFESVGTSGVLSLLLDRPKFDPLFMNRRHVIPGLWLAHGAMSMVGGALDWLRMNIFDVLDTPEALNELAEQGVPGANGVVFLPYLSGERCPVWDPKAKGVWYGLSITTDKIDLIEAVYESSAYALRQMSEHAKKTIGLEMKKIIAVGNGTKSNHWNQLKADILDVEYHLSTITDASAFGAAMMGGISAGIFNGIDDPQLPAIGTQSHVFYPSHDRDTEAYEKGFQVYNSLYPALKHVMNI